MTFSGRGPLAGRRGPAQLTAQLMEVAHASSVTSSIATALIAEWRRATRQNNPGTVLVCAGVEHVAKDSIVMRRKKRQGVELTRRRVLQHEVSRVRLSGHADRHPIGSPR